MRAAVIRRYGGNDVVQIEDMPAPRPGPLDLGVRVHAASVNPVDFKIREGGLKVLVPARFPLILGCDLSGEVVEDLSHVEAASIPLVGLTGWQALVEIGRLQRGQSVLIHAGGGGVGTFAIQLARHLGATVATTVGRRHVKLVEELGAHTAIDYRSEKFEDRLRDVDLVFDTQGGKTLERSFSVVRRGGTVVTIGGRPDGKFARAWGLNPLVVLALSLLSRKVLRLARRRDARFEYLFMRASGEQLERIAELLARGVIRPVVDRTFPLEQIRAALDYSQSGTVTGKLVITLQDPSQGAHV